MHFIVQRKLKTTISFLVSFTNGCNNKIISIVSWGNIIGDLLNVWSRIQSPGFRDQNL